MPVMLVIYEKWKQARRPPFLEKQSDARHARYL
jgi:hypothetical protein